MGYIKQALAMMREEKLYSAMYICGTALAIAFTMLIAEVYYIKVADIAPEVNRSKTYYLNGLYRGEQRADECIYSDTFRDLFQTMKTPECVTATTDMGLWNEAHMKLADNVHDRSVKVKLTEPGFFRFYQFHFTEGAPFTQDDFDSRSRTVVVTTEVAEQLFGKGAKASGQRINVIIATSPSAAWWRHPARSRRNVWPTSGVHITLKVSTIIFTSLKIMARY